MSDPTQPPVPDFVTRDPNSPEFWNERFERHFLPWDQAGVPSSFRAFAERHRDAAVLIPGCGSAYEAVWLAHQGNRVRAIDFSPAAVSAAREQLGAQHASLVEQADFFTYAPPFAPTWIYERAFFCALPPARRADYAQRMAELLPAALLAGFFFIGATPKGPPFGVERDELDALLTPHFELIEDEAVDDSIAVFAGRERWLTWRRRG
ncbi:thiopurine S-methyltransferase [Paraburkholderia monticola]|uniref:Thiopurine S-methyltransferase n=1 Tax=Paraburkholderia monticola TaxID=1399968 RepID=A0A149Q087_9BURK|nr:methyltransferase domain-containing protein [Paraburkholderia monticola]KXU90740.1 thiopurine S-methyltransferase [Paraburkholderia monticola]